MTRASSMHEAGHSMSVLWDNPVGWGGVGGVRGIQWGDTCAPVADCMLMYGETHHNIVISLKLK